VQFIPSLEIRNTEDSPATYSRALLVEQLSMSHMRGSTPHTIQTMSYGHAFNNYYGGACFV